MMTTEQARDFVDRIHARREAAEVEARQARLRAEMEAQLVELNVRMRSPRLVHERARYVREIIVLERALSEVRT